MKSQTASRRVNVFGADDNYLGRELKGYACPIGGTFFDELCLIMIGVAIDY